MSGTAFPLPSGRLAGRLRAPGSKSVTNRALVCAALANGESRLLFPLDADDTRALARCLEALGARVVSRAGSWTVSGPVVADPDREIVLDVGPAGTPARFLAALLPALGGRFVLDGSARMRERPMGPLVDALRSLGARIDDLGRPGFLPVRIVGGTLRGGRVAIRGDVSSQFLSALLLVGPLVPGGIELEIVGRAASAAYLSLTRQTIEAFSGRPGGGYRSATFRVPGDDSAACFPIAGALVSSGKITLDGLARASEQPDAVFRSWAEAAGGRLAWSGPGGDEALTVDATALPGPRALKPLSVDVDPAPDAALPLTALLAFAGGTSVLSGAGRLRDKESDRLASACDLVVRAGGVARAETAGADVRIAIDGAAGTPRAAAFAAHGDHRVAMSAAVLALALPPGSTLDDPGAASKSWPEFFDLWAGLVAPRG
ncbi:MAG TPA: 3-phosphoshikimate 1-carboxyvinyltransferase [Thermoanaerobaculia bacterium]|nr:3-phosphoshikimate 1-carboxyvinyltransferase [Thermoanaerobaculia bacterium]